MHTAAKLNLINLFQCDKGFYTNERVFDYHYLLFVHKGIGRYKVGNTLYKGTIGDIFYCPPYVGNTIFADEEDPFLLSGIEFVLYNHAETDSIIGQLLIKMNILNNSFLITVINRMITELSYLKTYSQQITDLLMSTLFFELMRIGKIGKQDDENVLLKMLDHIKSNLHREVTYAELSRIFSYHKSTIYRMVSTTTGASLREYQIDLRTKKAMELLSFSKKNQSEIATICGYNSAIFFSRQFKAKTGFTPSEYRRIKQNL
jgi:AraC-like DNA-binding protein